MEATVESSAVGVAKRHGWESRKVSWIGRRGAPDRLFLHEGQRRAVFIEFKDKGKKPTAQQRREAERMVNAGLEVHCGVDTLAEALEILGITS